GGLGSDVEDALEPSAGLRAHARRLGALAEQRIAVAGAKYAQRGRELGDTFARLRDHGGIVARRAGHALGDRQLLAVTVRSGTVVERERVREQRLFAR